MCLGLSRKDQVWVWSKPLGLGVDNGLAVYIGSGGGLKWVCGLDIGKWCSRWGLGMGQTWGGDCPVARRFDSRVYPESVQWAMGNGPLVLISKVCSKFVYIQSLSRVGLHQKFV